MEQCETGEGGCEKKSFRLFPFRSMISVIIWLRVSIDHLFHLKQSFCTRELK